MSNSLHSILRMQNTSLQKVTETRLIFEPHVARLAASSRPLESSITAHTGGNEFGVYVTVETDEWFCRILRRIELKGATEKGTTGKGEKIVSLMNDGANQKRSVP